MSASEVGQSGGRSSMLLATLPDSDGFLMGVNPSSQLDLAFSLKEDAS